MVTIKVLKGFLDLVANVYRKEGETFDATEERAFYIDQKLPGFISIEEKPKPKRGKKPAQDGE